MADNGVVFDYPKPLISEYPASNVKGKRLRIV